MTDHIAWDPPPRLCSSWSTHRFVTQCATRTGHLLLGCDRCWRGGVVFDASADEFEAVRQASTALPWPEPWRVRPLSDHFSELLASSSRPVPEDN
jgi:hypothetical protein